MDLKISTLEEANKTIVQLNGEVDVYTAPLLKETLTPISKQPNIEVIIDMSQVQYIDSTGLGIFIGALKTTHVNNSTLKLTGVNERIGRLLTITGLDEVIEIEESEREEV